MSWNLMRRESIIASQELLRSQSDDLFEWMEPATVGMFGDEKDVKPTVSYSPASTISSGPSSASSSPSSVRSGKALDVDEDSESEHSDFEPLTFDDNEAYTVINGTAYPVSAPIPEVRHLQLPASRHSSPYLPTPSNFVSASSSPNLYASLPLAPQTPPRREPKSPKKAKQSKRTFDDAEFDADADSDNASDDEYLPTSSRPHHSRKRARRHSPQSTTWPFGNMPTASSSSSPYTPPKTPARRPAKRVRNSPPSRNLQVPALSQPVEVLEMSFVCPECGWIQHNKRTPDFKRHLRTHTRPSDQDQSQGWWCKGVLVGNSSVPGEAYQFDGQLRTGGCLKTFSRRDALKRHLDNPNVSCKGCIDD
ncbi:hypothetical protein ONZ45_g10158 [Pleurotus djamor]|nr:hypothetical protein ONZ45_g10158 [Pleurotus djamor]